MKTTKIISVSVVTALACVMIFTTSCKKLSLQKDYNRVPDTVDSHIYKTAWQFIRDRSSGKPDSIFSRMYAAIIYSGIDTNEYTKSNRTYIILHNDAINRTSGSGIDNGFFFALQVNAKNGTKIEDYPKDFWKAYLQYLIIEGVYDHYTMPAVNAVNVSTLAPPGSLNTLPAGITRNAAFPLSPNANSSMKMRVLNSSPSNTSDYPIILNEARYVRTSSIQATNGSIHVIDRFLTTTNPD